jgi:hypothetical protein
MLVQAAPVGPKRIMPAWSVQYMFWPEEPTTWGAAVSVKETEGT